MPREAFLINPPAFYLPPPSGRKLSRTSRNPIGEEALIIGGGFNPPPPKPKKRAKARRKSKGDTMAAKKRRVRKNAPKKARRTRARRRVRRSPVTRVAAPKRRRARRSMVLAGNAPRRRKRSYRRKVRRNPVVSSGGAISIRRPMTLVMPIAVGVAGLMAADKVPAMLNLSGNSALAAQAGLMVGGGLLLPKFVGNTAATVFVAVVGAKMVSGLLNKYMFNTGLSGLGEIPYAMSPYGGGMSAFPNNQGMSAFPSDQLSGLGAAPFDVQY